MTLKMKDLPNGFWNVVRCVCEKDTGVASGTHGLGVAYDARCRLCYGTGVPATPSTEVRWGRSHYWVWWRPTPSRPYDS